MAYVIGFSGTQFGMTEAQEIEFIRQITDLFSMNKECEFHHGDCVGSDCIADLHVRYLCDNGFPIEIHIHPPIENSKRAHCERRQGNTIVHEAKKYIVRNNDIAFVSNILIATVKEKYEMRRSGTWSTIRRARKYNKPIILIYPDGSVKKENYD